MTTNPGRDKGMAGGITRKYRGQPGISRWCSLPQKILLLSFTLVCLGAMCGGVQAHPPSDIVVTYDQDTGDLGVTIMHQVDNPATHYIKQVTVRMGDTVLADQTYSSQPDRSSFTYYYNLPQLKGRNAEIRVDVQCSVFGSRTGTLVVHETPSAAAPNSATPSATPSAKSPASACAAIAAVGLAATGILRGYRMSKD